MKTHRVDVIIHLFAFLHVAVALMCRSFGIMDEIWLTLLSIIMVVLICVRMFAKVELIVATVIVTNFVGYIFGVYGAKLISCFIGEELAVHAISTFVTTEIIGWGTYSFLNLLKRNSVSKTFKSSPPRQDFQQTRYMACRCHHCHHTVQNPADIPVLFG